MDYQKTLHGYITTVLGRGASDLHLFANSSPVVRVFRELSVLTEEKTLSEEDIYAFLSLMLTPEQLELLKKKKSIEFSYSPEIASSTSRFRGNAYFKLGTPSIALRAIPESIPSLEELNLPTKLKDIAKEKQGFFIVVGPTGNGKSTTVAAILDHINATETKHIISIEDPVEFIISPKKCLISQKEVPIDTNSFNDGLVSSLRSDGDIIFVSEMRTYETMSTGIIAAEVGHLVFTTLHANGATQAVNRVIDVFPVEAQSQTREALASSLLGVFSVRLVPRNSGGLIPAYELFLNNSASANLIRSERTEDIQNVIQTNLHNGMISLDQSLANLVREGEISLESAYSYSTSKDMIDRFIK